MVSVARTRAMPDAASEGSRSAPLPPMSLRTHPGCMQTTTTPSGRNACDCLTVSMLSAAFDELYDTSRPNRWATSNEPTCDEMLATLPRAARRFPASNCTKRMGPTTLTLMTERNCSAVMSSGPRESSSAPRARASMPALLIRTSTARSPMAAAKAAIDSSDEVSNEWISAPV